MSNKLAGGIKAGSASVSLAVELLKASDSTALTGIVYSGVTASYWRQGGTRTAITTATLGSVDAAYSSGGFLEVDATNMPGVYRFDVPDAAFATGADWVCISLKVATAFQLNFFFALETQGASELSARIPAALTGDGNIKADVLRVNGTTQTAGDLASLITTVDTVVDAVKLKTDALPAAPAATGDIPSASTIATTVWASGSRTLTSFGTLVADIWANGSRTLSSFGTLVADIWANATRTLTSGAAPSAADIADAVCDEALSGHATAGTVGAALTAASSAGDPWATIVPGAYGEGTAGKAFGRLNIGSSSDPVIVLPDPPASAQMCRVVGYFEDVNGQPARNVPVFFELLSTVPLKGNKIIVEHTLEVRTDYLGRLADKSGNAYVDIKRTDQMTPSTKTYRIRCEAAKLDWTGTVTTTTLDLATKIT